MIRPFTFGAFESNSVVSRSVKKMALAKLRYSARRWLGDRPKVLPRLRCLIDLPFPIKKDVTG
jgi:hypothetical protein